MSEPFNKASATATSIGSIAAAAAVIIVFFIIASCVNTNVKSGDENKARVKLACIEGGNQWVEGNCVYGPDNPALK